jgi:hypothetical protein
MSGILRLTLLAPKARIVQLLVERVDVRMHGVEVRLRPNGLGAGGRGGDPGWAPVGGAAAG